jgi:SAM-dependent methyltransferase
VSSADLLVARAMNREPSAPDAARRAHLRLVRARPAYTVLNYGFSAEPEQTVIAADEPEFYCLRLYEHLLRDVPVESGALLELACGRGGGASFMSRTYRPDSLIGVDADPDNVRCARDLPDLDDVEFLLGDSRRLEFADDSFDVVVLIAPAALETRRTRSFHEVLRVLRPGGYFCYADGCWADDDCTEDLTAAGFDLLERQEITANVVRALRRDHRRRERWLDMLATPDERERYREAAALPSSRTYRRLEAGQARYFSHRLQRPRARAERSAPLAP